MSRKQRTPQEIEDEMNEQDQEQAEEVEEDEEEENEPDEEESEEEGEEEGEEEESGTEDESDMLIENYGAFLCLGYSPAQIDKHLPGLIETTKAKRNAMTQDMPGAIGEEAAKDVQDGYDEYFLPAFQEFFKEMRQKYGNDLVKLRKIMDWITGRLLLEVARHHFDHLTTNPWPKPENG